MFKKVKSKAPLTWTWKNMSILTTFQGFWGFVHFFMFKNTLKKLPKWTLQWLFLVHRSVLSPKKQMNHRLPIICIHIFILHQQLCVFSHFMPIEHEFTTSYLTNQLTHLLILFFLKTFQMVITNVINLCFENVQPF
jgi:hypothetical protein